MADPGRLSNTVLSFAAVAGLSLQMPGNAALFAVIAGMAIHDGRRV